MYSQDAASSSIYGSYGYFQRFHETQSSPFDSDFGEETAQEEEENAAIFHHQPEEDVAREEENKMDAAMMSSIIIDEASCYFSEESDDEPKSLPSNGGKDFNPNVDSGGCKMVNHVLINNTTLNVLRCIGRYVQMCKLLHSISPHIVSSMLELIDFYVYAVLDIFSKDVVCVSSIFAKIQSTLCSLSDFSQFKWRICIPVVWKRNSSMSMIIFSRI